MGLSPNADERDVLSVLISFVLEKKGNDDRHDEIANLIWEFAKFEICVKEKCLVPGRRIHTHEEAEEKSVFAYCGCTEYQEFYLHRKCCKSSWQKWVCPNCGEK